MIEIGHNVKNLIPAVPVTITQVRPLGTKGAVGFVGLNSEGTAVKYDKL